jgi:chaperonin GroEL (HSP60 family)
MVKIGTFLTKKVSSVSFSTKKVQHPAAKLLILASDMQEKEIGGGTNFVIIFGGQLLQNAADLLTMVGF